MNSSHHQLQVALLLIASKNVPVHFLKCALNRVFDSVMRAQMFTSNWGAHQAEAAVAEGAVVPAAAGPGPAAGRHHTCIQTAGASLHHRNLY